MRRKCEFICCVVVALLSCGVARGDGEGQSDLDSATEARLSARSPADLGGVVELCESALKKGLDNDNTIYAKQLLTDTLLERANQFCAPIFGQRPPNARWPQFKQLALRDLQKASKFNEKLAPVYMLMARLHALPGGDRDRATEAAEKAVELFVDDVSQRSKALALRGSLTQNIQQREKDFDDAVETDPQNIDALRLRGIHYLTQKRFDEAVQDLQQVLEKNPEDMAAMQAVAEAFTQLKKFDEAAKQLTRVIKLKPNSPGGYLLRARLNQLREDTDATLADANKVIELDEGNVFARMMRARIHFEKGDMDKAKIDVDRVIERNARLGEAILLRSMIFASDGKFAAAITDLNVVARAAPDNVPIRLQLAGLYNADDRPSKAIEIYDDVLATDSENFDALRGRGDAYLSIGKHTEAIADYEAAFKLNAENRSLLNNLAWVLATSPFDELRDAARAIKLATKACELTEYKMAHILSTLASAHAEAGDFETAKKWSTKACELGEGDVKEQLREELESYEAKKPWRERKQVEEEPEPEAPREDDLFID